MNKLLFTLASLLLSSVAMAQNTDINVDMNMDGMPNMGIDMNVNITETHSTTTTTNTTTTTGGNGDVYVMPGYNGPIGCEWPMDEGQFQQVRSSVSSKDWDETRLKVAKQVISSNCLTSSQVKELVGIMEWEASKLDFAKFAYGLTYDIGNYYMINDAFEWDASIDELDEYINGYRW